jgi:sn-glycerol 3-phosphate transport system substrate-binding protein
MKHLSRRLAAIIAVLAVVAAACGGGSDGPETAAPDAEGVTLPTCPVDALDAATAPVDVTVWHTQTARPLEVLDELVDEYNASQDRVKVHLESQGASYPEIQRKFNESVASRQLPALIVVDDTFTESMADSGVILPAQACFDADGYDLDQLELTARSYYTIDGSLWPVMAGIGTVLLYYNRDHFRRAGLDPDKTPATLAELREYAQKIKDAGVAEKPFVHELAAWKTEFWLTGARSAVVDNDNGRGEGATARATLAGNPEALALFTWFKEMADDGLLDPVPATAGQINQYLALANRSSSILIDTSSAATSIEAFLGGTLDPSTLGADEVADASGLDLGVGTFPGLTEPGRTQMGGDAWYLTNTGSPEVQAGAWDFARFMNTPHAQARMLVGGSYLPWVTAAADDPSVVEYFAGKGGVAGTWLKLANDLVKGIDPSFPGPLIGPYDRFREALEQAQDALLFGGSSPSDALDEAQKEVDTDLERYNANA